MKNYYRLIRSIARGIWWAGSPVAEAWFKAVKRDLRYGPVIEHVGGWPVSEGSKLFTDAKEVRRWRSSTVIDEVEHRLRMHTDKTETDYWFDVAATELEKI